MADYHYREGKGADQSAPLFLVFHATGGDENQFFELADELLPGARVIAPRSAFVAARKAEGAPRRVVGLGYSNGANILAAVQFAAPGLFDATVLMHPLIPFTPPDADFTGKRVLITAGKRDPMAAAAVTQGLSDYFAGRGAETSLFWHQGGHELRPEELREAQVFLGRP